MRDESKRVRWWPLVVVLVLVVAAVAVPLLLHRGGEADETRTPVASGGGDWRWVGFHDVEVKAPADWKYGYDAIRPDCIDDPGNPKDPWAKDVPKAPYVMVGGDDRVVPAIGCTRRHRPGDPAAVFGELPFALWQPYVALAQARPDLRTPDRRDGTWRYHRWTLTRTTVGSVQITVLASPGSDVGPTVVDSVRRVKTTALGCDTASAAQHVRFARPTGPSVPPAAAVSAVTVCDYSRMKASAGLQGSRRITGTPAKRLVETIRSAPEGGGPNEPAHCLSTMHGDRALALRFFGKTGTKPIGEAFVYFDWCFGNGIVDANHQWRLTASNCKPLFARPPITLWSGQASVFRICR